MLAHQCLITICLGAMMPQIYIHSTNLCVQIYTDHRQVKLINAISRVKTTLKQSVLVKKTHHLNITGQGGLVL